MDHQPNSETKQAISQFGLKAVRPLFWHDTNQRPPRKLTGASCFALQFKERLIGVTAAHVILEYQTAKRQCSTLICQLQNTEFDLDRALVAVDTEHDIATFRVTHDQLSRASGVSFDCTGEWPPRMPEVDQVLQLVGFPENIRRVNQSFRGEYGAYGAFAAVEDVTPRDIIVTYDPQRDKAVSWVPEMPPLGYNMSGCSGGPALTHDIRNGLHRWHVVGMINSGPGNRAEGSFAGLDIIKIRRIDCIQSDGAIANVTGGW